MKFTNCLLGFIIFFYGAVVESMQKEKTRNDTLLLRAARDGKHEDVIELLKAKTKPDGFDAHRPLCVAAGAGHIEVVKALLDKTDEIEIAKINKRGISSDGGHLATALHFAVEEAHIEVVTALLERGARINKASTFTSGYTPLHVAIWANNYEITSALLNALSGEAKILSELLRTECTAILSELLRTECAAATYGTPLDWALTNSRKNTDNRKIIILLLKFGSPFKVSDSGYLIDDDNYNSEARLERYETLMLFVKYAPKNQVVNQLCLGCEKDDYESVFALLEVDAIHRCSHRDATPLYALQNDQGYTPIYAAAKSGNDRIVQLLLSNSIDINMPHPDGSTPLLVAAEGGYTAIVYRLLRAGAAIDRKRGDETALSRKVSMTNSKLMKRIELLETETASGDSKASKAELEKKAKLLEKLKKNVVEPENKIIVYLKEAEDSFKAIEESKRITKVPSFCNVTYRNGITPLSLAAEMGNDGHVKLLLDAAGTDVDKNRDDGVTPLFIAAGNGHYEVVRLLLEAGADIGKSRDDGKTPLSIATDNHHVNVVELLTSAQRLLDAQR